MRKQFITVWFVFLVLIITGGGGLFVYAQDKSEGDGLRFVLSSIFISGGEEVLTGTPFTDTQTYENIALMRVPGFIHNIDDKSDDRRIVFPVLSWDISEYNEFVPGIYTIYGELDSFTTCGIPFENPDNIRATFTIIVSEPRLPVFDTNFMQRSNDMLILLVWDLSIWSGCNITVWQSDDEGESWFELTGAEKLLLFNDGFLVFGLEEERIYGFKIDIHGTGLLQGESEPIFVLLEEGGDGIRLLEGDRTGRRPSLGMKPPGPEPSPFLPDDSNDSPVDSPNDKPQNTPIEAPVNAIIDVPAEIPADVPVITPLNNPVAPMVTTYGLTGEQNVENLQNPPTTIKELPNETFTEVATHDSLAETQPPEQIYNTPSSILHTTVPEPGNSWIPVIVAVGISAVLSTAVFLLRRRLEARKP